MKVGLARTPALRGALRKAGVRLWSSGLRLAAGDILILDAALGPEALRRIPGLLLPDVEILLLDDEAAGPAPTARWPWRRLSLPRDHAELAGLRTVLPATTVLPTAGHLQPATVRLEVRDRLSPAPPPAHPDTLRRAFTQTGLPWPDDATLTVRVAPAGHPPHRQASLAVAAALLASTGTIPPAALRRCAFVGAVAPDGQVRPLPHPAATCATARAAGYRHLAAPVHCGGPGLTVHPVATVADLVALPRP
ncbi:hypothetical protein E0F15_11140 [Frankia sp. B2]|uniref:hypothetical protein n=1 Tax=Frankia sp. B2 TaxID=2541730 RepID=UPI00106D1ED9|nr:hypothetical protein [Frankia sp. B2]TFE31029.1 hypothetical protein E0F15_11140 [Frankia sp. B2]